MLNEKIKKAFEKIYGRKLSQKEIEEMLNNLVGFFELINKFKNEDEERKPK